MSESEYRSASTARRRPASRLRSFDLPRQEVPCLEMPLLRQVSAGWIVAAIAVTAAATLAASAQSRLSARDILNRIDDLYRGDSAHGVLTMTVKTEHWERTLQIEFWSKGKDESLLRILAPKKEAGTATLRSGNDIWNYLPHVKRVIKLPSSMMSASWMGSHFTNDDLVKESRMAEDYTYEITFEGERSGRQVVELTLTPKPQAAIVWGKVVVTVDRARSLPIETRYFDEDQRLARTLTFSDVAPLGGRELPTALTALPADKPGESTVIRYQKLEFNVPLEDQFFSLRTLQR
jgi:outer membrane lipoprotein-sorting protein